MAVYCAGIRTPLVKEVCALTHNATMRHNILSAICEAMENSDKGSGITHDDAKTASKSLNLFEYILCNGLEETVELLLGRINLIRRMTKFNMWEVQQYAYGRDNDKGASVRKKAFQMLDVMEDHGQCFPTPAQHTSGISAACCWNYSARLICATSAGTDRLREERDKASRTNAKLNAGPRPSQYSDSSGASAGSANGAKRDPSLYRR